MATKILAGTSGYSYKEWRGHFYPEDLAQDQWLAFYARELPAVEINNTFYRMPREHVVAAWRDAVPDTFRFVIKASRRITHQSRLNNADEACGYLVQRARVLGDKLGAVLFQLPPAMALNLERLQAFQTLLPDDIPAVFEFRHDSWNVPEVADTLRAHGHGRVVSHDENAVPQDVPEGNITYLRLRASRYTLAALKKWHARVLASGADNAFVFFKHEDAGAGPRLAKKFLDIPATATAGRAASKTARPKAAAKKAARKRSTKRQTAS